MGLHLQSHSADAHMVSVEAHVVECHCSFEIRHMALAVEFETANLAAYRALDAVMYRGYPP